MKWLMILATVVTIISLQIKGGHAQEKGGPQVPCFFIFGDSLSDAGNNNNLISLARADFLPYGIDFPDGATGRFTNGRTAVDLIGDHLGLDEYIPSYLKANKAHPDKGVNYASGSAGIRPETGFQVGMRVSMDEQLKRHQEITSKLPKSNLNQCMYSVYVGSNDWMLNFFNGLAQLTISSDRYTDELIGSLHTQLGKLYTMGARKFIVWGMMPLGCMPLYNFAGICFGPINDILRKYNARLRTLVMKLNDTHKDAKFIWINSMDIFSADGLKNLGLKISSIACCGAINFVCVPFMPPCFNRSEHAYWDNAHPTEAANKYFANRAFHGKPGDSYPMDISKLAQLKL